MSNRIHNPISRAVKPEATAPAARTYRGFHDEENGGSALVRKQRYKEMVNHYYDLVTDFYEFGWGRSFHFAPRKRRESFEDSLVRHELFLAMAIGLDPGMKVLDVGCGVGGPMRLISREFGAHVVGLNNNAYQLGKCEAYNREAGLQHRTELLQGDFMRIPAAEASFDAAYQIEATPHAPDKEGAFAEIWRVLRPGGVFGGYEWCLTTRYNAGDPDHQAIKKGIETGNSLPDIASFDEVRGALRNAGFEAIESFDAADGADPETSWYRALEGRDLSLKSLPRTTIGRFVTTWGLRILEPLRFVPKGTTDVQDVLNVAADNLVAGGRLGIFTPMFYFKARKPESRAPARRGNSSRKRDHDGNYPRGR